MKYSRQLRLIIVLFLVFFSTNLIIVGENTEVDRNVARGLFSDAKKLKSKATSYGHLNVESVQKNMLKAQNLGRHEQLIKKALAMELEMTQKGYVVFYTAIPHMRLFHDVTRKMYEKRIGSFGDKKFQFIRFEYNNPLYSEYDNVRKFLIQELAKEGIVDDNQVRLRTILVSANLAFFGNIGLPGESTFHYLSNPQEWVTANPEFLQKAVISYGYSESFVSELMKLIPLTIANRGDLFQISIPKELVNEISYKSWRRGIPYDPDFINAIFPEGKWMQSVHEKINERIADYKERYKKGDPDITRWTQYLIDNVNLGKYNIVPEVLKKYAEGRSNLLNTMQARLLITNKYLLNPNSGIVIIRYGALADKARKAEYKAQLDNIFEKMEAERLQRAAATENGRLQGDSRVDKKITNKPVATR